MNRVGLDFYERLVDRLLENGITPCVTLYHWDLPAALGDRGGWLAADSPAWFAEYAQVLFAALDDRVPLWVTLNEPWVVVDAGCLFGVHAPGHRSLGDAAIAMHQLQLAHGAAVRAYRASGRHEIGIVVNLEPKEAASDVPADAAATRRVDAYMNRAYLDAVLFGRYPSELPEVFGDAWAPLREADLTPVRESIDFVGINHYTRAVVRHDEAGQPARASSVRQPSSLYTETGWEVHPGSLERVLRWVHDRYGPFPLYVTENGAAFADPSKVAGGAVHDPLRVAYLRAALRAIEAGVERRGYFAWSLLDNFEWAEGYSKRFGLAHVDFDTQRRTLKSSAHFYRDVIASHGGALDSGPRLSDGR